MSRTILIVEDYEDTRHLMKFLIESYDYQVIEAADGLEALECMNLHFPDLILMDVSMPRMDGLTATREIRKVKGNGNIPIIAVTAHGKQFYQKALDAGCNALINKPVDFGNLKQLLEQYLDQ